MENENLVEKIANLIGQHASVKNIFGEPIVTQNKTIIPVVRIVFGVGGGHGQKFKKNKNQSLSDQDKDALKDGEGAGGGGGMYAKPVGVYEVTERGTNFIPANITIQLIVAAFFGFLIKGLLFSKKKKS